MHNKHLFYFNKLQNTNIANYNQTITPPGRIRYRHQVRQNTPSCFVKILVGLTPFTGYYQ
jgi:hypothetical protein